MLALCFEWSSVNFSSRDFLSLTSKIEFHLCVKQVLLAGVCNRRDVLLLSTDASPPITFLSLKNRERVALIWTPSPLAEEKGALLLKGNSIGREGTLQNGYEVLR